MQALMLQRIFRVHLRPKDAQTPFYLHQANQNLQFDKLSCNLFPNLGSHTQKMNIYIYIDAEQCSICCVASRMGGEST